MSEVVVGLDVHLKNTQVTVMKLDGEVVKKERIKTCKAEIRRSLKKCRKVVELRWSRLVFVGSGSIFWMN